MMRSLYPATPPRDLTLVKLSIVNQHLANATNRLQDAVELLQPLHEYSEWNILIDDFKTLRRSILMNIDKFSMLIDEITIVINGKSHTIKSNYKVSYSMIVAFAGYYAEYNTNNFTVTWRSPIDTRGSIKFNDWLDVCNGMIFNVARTTNS